jgi:hypothetical protein
MMRLLMNGHDRHLPVATRICRLPCRALASDGDTIRNETEDDESERWRRAHHVGNPSAISCASPQPHGTFDCGLSGADASAELTPSVELTSDLIERMRERRPRRNRRARRRGVSDSTTRR